MRPATLTRILHSRGVAAVASLLAVAAAVYYYVSGGTGGILADRGFALPSANEWIPEGWGNFLSAMAVNALVVVMAALMNKVYNILRSMTGLYITLFAFMQAATPGFFTQFYTGPVLALAVAVGLYLLFGCYRSTQASWSVFIVFMMLSLLTATQYCFGLFMPAFLICCAQMRIFNGRTLVAAFLGTLTPWWILLGFGIVTPQTLHVPDFRSIFAELDPGDMLWTLISAGFTGLLLVLSIILNVFKTIAYNARSRAVNGAITVTALFAIVGACADFSNIPAYIPLLNFCAAIQTAHYFSTHRADRSCFAILAVIAVYVALYLCQTVI